MTANTINAAVRGLLVQACLSSVKASAAVQAAQEKAKGAYTLYVLAAIEAKTPETLAAASDDLFTEIRTTGKVRDDKGRAQSIGAKPNKDATGYLVPSAISSAKSYMLEAMTRGIALVEDGKARPFSAIRGDVQTAKQAEREATATGDEKVRIHALKMLSVLTDQVSERKGEDLARMHKAIEACYVASQSKSEPSKATAIAAAAEPSKTAKAA